MTLCWNDYAPAYGNMTIEFAVGSAPGLADIVDWTVPSGGNCITIPSSVFPEGDQSYISLRGETFNGLMSETFSTDGVTYLDPIMDHDNDGHTTQDEIVAKSNPQDPESTPGETFIHLYPGFNLVSNPAEMLFMDSAFKLLPLLGEDQEIEKVVCFNDGTGQYEQASYQPVNILTGIDCPNKNGEAHIIYSDVEKIVTFTSKVCPKWNLSIGLNPVGTLCATVGLTAFQLLSKVGGETAVNSIQRYKPITGQFDTAAYENGQLVGEDFPIVASEGYFVYMKQEAYSLRP